MGFSIPWPRTFPSTGFERNRAAGSGRSITPPTARMNAATLATLGLKDGDAVRVCQGEGVAALKAQQDERVPANCVRVAAAHAATAMLGDMFATINVERA